MADELLVMRDLVDEQLRTADERPIARVADIAAEWRPDGRLVLTDLLVGPQALAARVWRPLAGLVRAICRDRFEHRVPMSEIARHDLDLWLRRASSDYRVGQADRWVMDHLFRFIPGSGR